MKEKDIIDLFKKISIGCKTLFDNNILHRDLKPENILIKEGIPKIGKIIYYDLN